MTASPGVLASLSRVRCTAASVSCSSASPWTASCRREASSDAMSSDDGDVERTRRIARAIASASTRSPWPTCSIADCVRDPAILWVLVSTASAPSDSALAGTSGWKPKCGPHDWSTTSGTPAA